MRKIMVEIKKSLLKRWQTCIFIIWNWYKKKKSKISQSVFIKKLFSFWTGHDPLNTNDKKKPKGVNLPMARPIKVDNHF